MYTSLKILLLALSSLIFHSCNYNTFSSESVLIEYLRDDKNGFISHKTVNGVEFTLMYRPTDLLVKQELGDLEFTDQRVKALRAKYRDYLYFNLSMSKNGQELLNTAPKNKNEFGEMVSELAFGMRDKINLFTKSKDTLEMIDFIYPRTYGMSRSTTIMFIYPRIEEYLKEEYFNFTIRDLGLGTGEIKFKIHSSKINNEPHLSFKK